MATLLLQLLTSGVSTAFVGVVFTASAAVAFLGRFIPMLMPYRLLAVGVMGLSLAVGGFNIGYSLADSTAQMRMLQSELASKNYQLQVQKDTAAYYEKAYTDLQKSDEELDKKVSDDANQLKDDDACRADSDFVRQLHDIQ